MDDKDKLAWSLSHDFRAPVCTMEGVINIGEMSGDISPAFAAMMRVQVEKWHLATARLTKKLLTSEECRQAKWTELLIEAEMMAENIDLLYVSGLSEEIKGIIISLSAQIEYLGKQIDDERKINKDLS